MINKFKLLNFTCFRSDSVDIERFKASIVYVLSRRQF
jgi:hypothetical protein